MSTPTPVFRVDLWLKRAVGLLDASGVPSARLDALILLEDVTDKERGWLLAHPEFGLSVKQMETLDEQITRRTGHEPLAYIRGKSEFYGREFKVTPATLQPRPETETMITLLKNILEHNNRLSRVRPQKNDKDVVICDVGTGSGCLAITAKLEWPESQVLATEINQDALKVAKENAKSINANVKFYQGNLLEPLLTLNLSPYALLCNLPYVPDSHTINEAAMQEPKVAIFGGEDGLDLYRELFDQIAKLESKPKYILTESLPFQHEEQKNIARNSGYSLQETRDFVQIFIRNKAY